MSQQINLINLALRKKRDLLTAVPLAIAAGVILVVLLAISSVARQQADVLQVDAEKRNTELKASQARLLELGKTVTDFKPNQELVDELANSRAMLNLREEVIGALEGGAFRNSKGFAEFMRGFARQAPSGLWLTGFILNAGGEDIEIRGRMLKSTALPEYIRRLNSEKAFQGRSFSSLVIQLPEGAEGLNPASAPPVAAKRASSASTSPAFVEFVLRTKPVEGAKTSAPTNSGALPLEIRQ